MSDFNWCHGPQCHEKHTVDRVRGVKGSKVLRTRKIKLTNGTMVVNGVSSAVIIVKMIFGKSTQLKSLPLRRGPSVKKHRY